MSLILIGKNSENQPKETDRHLNDTNTIICSLFWRNRVSLNIYRKKKIKTKKGFFAHCNFKEKYFWATRIFLYKKTTFYAIIRLEAHEKFQKINKQLFNRVSQNK